MHILNAMNAPPTRAAAFGFTIVELMTTIMVASILLAVAVPSFRKMTVTNRLTTQANDMVSAVNLARSEAIKRNASVSLCRAGSDTATACVTSADTWQYWIVRAASGNVIRRGSIGTYANTIVVQSTLTTDQAVFGSDGLVRTGGVLVNGNQISVCATSGSPADNIRHIVLGSGSRISTTTLSGGC
jgi:type IV fimbrial biogenesis protein FimT